MDKPFGPSGFINVNKPSGITSFDVIRELRRTLRIRKMGHSGVLDKPATGVLVVGLNKATRLFELFTGFEKEYTADVWLGLSTTTDDLTGELIEAKGFDPPGNQEILQGLKSYTGTIDQIPPAFSLAKKGGKELYRYALAGKEVEVDPKRVTVLEAKLVEVEHGIEPTDIVDAESKLAPDTGKLPRLSRLRLEIRCVGGVYIRSIARDLGADLGCGGSLGRLVRTRVGPYRLEDSLTLADIAGMAASEQGAGEAIQPLSSIAPETMQLKLDPKQLGMIRNGISIRRFKHHLPASADKTGDIVYGLDPGNDLAAVLRVGGINQHGLVELKPEKVLA